MVMVHAPVDRAAPAAPATPSPMTDAPVGREQTRARYPDVEGVAERDGGRIGFEVYGTGDPPIMFVPPWIIVHSRIWKAQIPDFARRHRVIAWDARGNGRSDRPTDPTAHGDEAIARDLLAVLDASGTEAAVLVGLSSAVVPQIIVASNHPDRVLGLVLIAPSVPLGERLAERDIPFEDVLDTDEGWAKQNRHFWRRDFRSWLEFFFGHMFNEPHSTKQIEDAVGYGTATDADTLGATMSAPSVERDAFLGLCAALRCPVLIIQGDRDAISGPSRGLELARAIPHAQLDVLEGGGHGPSGRDPVRVNLLIRAFIRDLGSAS
jgi:pimeloyl-ACP methyl ester carboxylesterase